MNHGVPGCPDLWFSPIDVRDVAAVHLAAMTTPGAAGNRFLCGIERHSMRDVADVLVEHFSHKGYKIPTRRLPNLLVNIVARFDRTVALTLLDLSRPFDIDNRPTSELLGRPLRDLETIVVARAQSLEHYGHVRPRQRFAVTR
jgi:nucleoside-diphosphate-sugar epimerase